MKLTYYSKVKEGKLQKEISLLISEEIKSFEGKRIEITIQKSSSRRSNQQNRLYWLYIGIISKEIGYTKDELHEIVKYKFLKREKVDEKTGEVFEYLGSTSELNKMDFADFISDLTRWTSETFNIVLPDPHTIQDEYEGEED